MWYIPYGRLLRDENIYSNRNLHNNKWFEDDSWSVRSGCANAIASDADVDADVATIWNKEGNIKSATTLTRTKRVYLKLSSFIHSKRRKCTSDEFSWIKQRNSWHSSHSSHTSLSREKVYSDFYRLCTDASEFTNVNWRKQNSENGFSCLLLSVLGTASLMYWNRTTTGAIREEMPLSSISHVASTPTAESVNPGTSAQITSTCCTPPPSYHNINLPLGHPSTLTNERGAPPSYEEAIDPNGTNISVPIFSVSNISVHCHCFASRHFFCKAKGYLFQHHRRLTIHYLVVWEKLVKYPKAYSTFWKISFSYSWVQVSNAFNGVYQISIHVFRREFSFIKYFRSYILIVCIMNKLTFSSRMYHHSWSNNSGTNLHDGDWWTVSLRLSTGWIHSRILVSRRWIWSI